MRKRFRLAVFRSEIKTSNHIICIKGSQHVLIISARITSEMLLITLLLSLYFTSPILGLMKVSTYNLWNIMFNWDVRKYRIARMVSRLWNLQFLQNKSSSVVTSYAIYYVYTALILCIRLNIFLVMIQMQNKTLSLTKKWNVHV